MVLLLLFACLLAVSRATEFNIGMVDSTGHVAEVISELYTPAWEGPTWILGVSFEIHYNVEGTVYPLTRDLITYANLEFVVGDDLVFVVNENSLYNFSLSFPEGYGMPTAFSPSSWLIADLIVSPTLAQSNLTINITFDWTPHGQSYIVQGFNVSASNFMPIQLNGTGKIQTFSKNVKFDQDYNFLFGQAIITNEAIDMTLSDSKSGAVICHSVATYNVDGTIVGVSWCQEGNEMLKKGEEYKVTAQYADKYSETVRADMFLYVASKNSGL